MAENALVFAIFLAAMGAFALTAIPPLAQQTSELNQPCPLPVAAGHFRRPARSGACRRSTIAGVVVAAVALTVSLPVCIATIVFFVVFRLIEDYLMVPRMIGRAVKVPAEVTVVAVLLGGALLGIVGALVAIPVAAALQLLTQEVLYPRLDEV